MKGTIPLPDVNPKRQLARRIADAALSGVPIVGGPMQAIYSVAFPSRSEQETRRWQEDVTARLNDIALIVDDLTQAIPLTEEAAHVGIWISQSSEFGRPSPIDLQSLHAQFPSASQTELTDALGELEASGLVNLTATFGHPVAFFSPRNPLFEVFDPITQDTVPRADAAVLARRILHGDGTLNAAQTYDDLAWSTRRINPALGILGQHVSDERKSKEQGPYLVPYLFTLPVDRAHLRRFADRVLGPDDAGPIS
jgi:hypothetical protein